MERIVVILAIFLLLAFYWGYLIKNWDNLSQDGAAGLSICGMLLSIGGIVMIFNIGYILNH